jgi:hypothetical protein
VQQESLLIITSLIIHGLMAVALLGALTHQAIAVAMPEVHGGQSSFVSGLRSVSAAKYTSVIVTLYLLTAVIGWVIYPDYRLNSRGIVEAQLRAAMNSFELKEHFVAIGMGLLPAYWYYWRAIPLDQERETRRILTLLLAAIVWWSFLVGHVVNNVKGVGV